MLPKRRKAVFGEIRAFIRYMFAIAAYRGHGVECPCCGGTFEKFLPGGVNIRVNALCPACGSLERHRLLWLYLRNKTDFFTNKLKVLDIAPMVFHQMKLRSRKNLDYVSADISLPHVMFNVDITDMKFGEGQFDCVICLHVLEHVLDDRKAMQEIYRVLKPGGWAILQTPVDCEREVTFEDPQIVSSRDRAVLFGQADHVRVYGRDYENRLRESGFAVRVDNYTEELGDIAVAKFGLMPGEMIYFCEKPGTSSK